MSGVGLWRVDLGHVGVDARPLAGASWLYVDVVVVLEGDSVGCGVVEELMHFFAFVYSRCEGDGGLGALLCGSVTPCLGLQLEHPACVGHLEVAPVDVVVVGLLVDVPEPSPPHVAGCSPVVVESCAVRPGLEGYVVSEVVACGVLDAFHEPVVEYTPEVVSLLPCHFADVAERSEAELGVVLVAPCLLALSVFVDVTWQRTVVVCVEVVVDGGAVEGGVVEEDGAGHALSVDDGSPVAVGVGTVGFELLECGQYGSPHHVLPSVEGGGGGTGFEEVHGADEVVTLYAAEGCVVSVESL